MSNKQKYYIIGHKNPDTDSICSAIALAYLKNQTEDGNFVPKRAGQINEETEYVLDYFGIKAPGYMPNLGAQAKDMEIRQTKGMSKEMSVKRAWDYMVQNQIMTLPLTDAEDRLEGILSMSDLARKLMDQNPSVLSAAKTPFKHIAETLDGQILTEDKDGVFEKGKVFVGACNEEAVDSYIEDGDLVMLGNRESDHINAIENGAGCIVVAMGGEVSKKVIETAEKHNCVVISTPLDTYAVAQRIEQSVPIRALMVAENLITFKRDDFIEKIRTTMGKTRIRNFPVLDKHDRYVGTVSRRNLLNIPKKKVILVDHNEYSQAADNIDQAEILEIVDHHRLGTLETNAPIVFRNQPLGCTGTIIYQMFNEKGVDIPKEIAGLMLAAILSDTLMFRSPTCTQIDIDAGHKLAEIAEVDYEKFAAEMFRAGSNLAGKTAEEIFYQDFKKFIAGDVSFGVGQISAMAADELQKVKERLEPHLQYECGKHGISMVFFMLTNIMEESTELICYGGDSVEVVKEAFGVDVTKGSCVLQGIVSRKKQLIPAMMSALQEGEL